MIFTPLDLGKMPEPSAVQELSFDEVLSLIITRFKIDNPHLAASVDFESDPITAQHQALSYRETVWRAYLNQALRAGMLAFSSGSNLDHLAALIPLARRENESDDELRARVQLAPEGFSTAGPIGGYIFHVKGASPDITDVYVPEVTQETRGEVHVWFLGNDIADDAALTELVSAALSDDVRPLNDFVTIKPALRVDFEVDAVLSIQGGPDSALVVQNSLKSAQVYIDSRHKFGADITRAGLFAALITNGVENVDLISPAQDVVISNNSAPRLTSITVTEAIGA